VQSSDQALTSVCICCGNRLTEIIQPSWNPAKAPYIDWRCQNKACCLDEFSFDASLYAIDAPVRMNELKNGAK
jgi:hypothetical protein